MPLLWWIFGIVLVGIAINIVSGDVKIWLQEKPTHLALGLAAWVLIGCVVLIAYRAQRKHQLVNEFDLYTTSEGLKPEDVGFKTAKPGDDVAQPRRPYFATYISRTAIPYADRHRSDPSVVYREQDLVAAVQKGESLLLVGVPTEGKTRTLFELVKRTNGFVVVRPKRDRTPSEQALGLLRRKKVICLLDDLNSFAGTPVDLFAFFGQVSRVAGYCAVVGACRDGPELATLDLRTTPLHLLYESFQHKLILCRVSDEDKARLQRDVGGFGDDTETTLGSICMRGAYQLMSERFRQIDPAAQDCHRAIQLLAAGGVEPFTHARIHRLLTDVFQREAGFGSLRDCLKILSQQGFLVSAGDADPVSPEAAYVQGANARTFYLDNREVEDDLPKLAEALKKLEDGSGLFNLAWSRSLDDDTTGEIRYYDELVEYFGDRRDLENRTLVGSALYNKGVRLGQLNRFEEAIVVYDAVISRFGDAPELALRERVATALYNKGATLGQLDRSEEAIVVYDAVISRFGDAPELALCEQVATAHYARSACMRGHA